MKFAISLGLVHNALWIPLTQEADRLGYESVWLPEHLVLPVQMAGSPVAGDEHPPVLPSVPVFDAWVYIGLLAGQTSRVRLGTNVFNIGLRHPFVTARAVATADVLSGGRIEFGVGSSWLREEWDAAGLDFDTRGARVDESIEVCRRLWAESVVEHHGRFYDFDAVMFEPKPAQIGGPPIVIGGNTKVARRRAATHGDGWIPLEAPLEEVASGRREIEARRSDLGRGGPFEVSCVATVGGADDLVRLDEAGVDRAFVQPWTRTRDALDGIRRFAEQYIDH